MLAGVSFGIWVGFNPLNLSPSTYIEQQQNMLHGLKTFMISLVLFATIITLVLVFIHKSNKAVFIPLLVAVFCFLASIIITRFGNLPIDNVVMTWDLGNPPSNWTDLRNEWWFLHKCRTVTEVIALVLVV